MGCIDMWGKIVPGKKNNKNPEKTTGFELYNLFLTLTKRVICLAKILFPGFTSSKAEEFIFTLIKFTLIFPHFLVLNLHV